jgi:predicted nucleic acid-binding protein
MAYIVTHGAALRLIIANRRDPLTQWIEKNEIRPFITETTMALTRHSILQNDVFDAGQRQAALERYDRMVADLNGDRRRSVVAAVFDLNSAEILSQIISIRGEAVLLSDMDLMPAAIAIQHNLELVVCEDLEEWRSLTRSIPPVLGTLSLTEFLMPVVA